MPRESPRRGIVPAAHHTRRIVATRTHDAPDFVFAAQWAAAAQGRHGNTRLRAILATPSPASALTQRTDILRPANTVSCAVVTQPCRAGTGFPITPNIWIAVAPFVQYGAPSVGAMTLFGR